SHAEALGRRRDRGADDDQRVGELVLAFQPGLPRPSAGILEAVAAEGSAGNGLSVGTLRSLAWAGGRPAPPPSLPLRRRTDHRHWTRAPIRSRRTAAREPPQPLPFGGRYAAIRS